MIQKYPGKCQNHWKISDTGVMEKFCDRLFQIMIYNYAKGPSSLTKRMKVANKSNRSECVMNLKVDQLTKYKNYNSTFDRINTVQ